MKFTIKNGGKENIITLARKISYQYLREEEEEMSFIRPLERSGYPRFHLFLKIHPETQELIFNLHLDQKKANLQRCPSPRS